MKDKEFLYKKFGYETIIINSLEDIYDMNSVFIKEKPKYACYDTETTGLNHMIDTPFIVTFGFNKYIYLCDNSNLKLFNEFIKIMFMVVQIDNILLFAHNAKYDRHMLINNNTPIPKKIRLADTQTLARLVTPCDDDFSSVKLEDIGERFVDPDSKFGSELIGSILIKLRKIRKKIVCDNYKMITGATEATTAWNTFYSKVNYITEYHEAFNDYKEPTYYDVYIEEPELMRKYAIDDVVIMLEFIKKVMPIYAHKYTKNSVVDNSVFFRENELISSIGDIERNGFTVDLQYLIDSHYNVTTYKEQLYKQLHTLTSEVWTVGQHDKIKEFFLINFNITLAKVDKKNIRNLLANENEQVRKIAEVITILRTVDKWLSTYIDGFLNRVMEVNGVYKLYTTIHNNGTVSGRVSSNLQQMPREPICGIDKLPITLENGDMLFNPRNAIIPSENTKLFFLDFSQVELRVQAFYTILAGFPDYNLCRAYMPYGCIDLETYESFNYKNPEHIKNWNSGNWINPNGTSWVKTDMHSMTTHNAFPELIDESTKEFKQARYLGKMTNFSCNYGVGVAKLSDQLDVSMEIAQRLRTSYNNSYPGITQYGKKVNNMLAMKGFVENSYGRKYYIDNRNNYYKCANYLIQGSCADSLKDIELRVCDYLKDKQSKFIIPIHDELVFEVVNGEEYIIPEIKKIMENVKDKFPYVPIVCEVEYTATNWGSKDAYEI